MKKCGLLTLICAFLSITFIKTIEAKLTIIPPQEMVQQSTLILIGNITKKEFSDEHRLVSISIETVVKGQTNQTEIVLQKDRPPMYGWLGFDFPEIGTRVMVLLQQQNDQLKLTGDANAVAVLEDNNVRLYKGMTMGQWSPEQFERTYQGQLEKSTASAQSAVVKLNGTTILGVKPHHLIHKVGVLINIAVIIGLVAATSFFVYRTFKHNRLK